MRKLINGIPVETREGLNSYSYIEHGETFHRNWQICLSGLLQVTHPEELNYYIIPAAGRRKAQDAFNKWIMEESAFRNAFSNRQTKDLYHDGVDINLEQQKSYCVSAMIALRFPWEFPEQVKLWNLLVEMGVKEGLAHIISSFFKEEEAGNFTHYPLTGAHGNFRYLRDDVVRSYALNTLPKPLTTELKSFLNGRSGYSIYNVLEDEEKAGEKVSPCSLNLPMSNSWKIQPIKRATFFKEVLSYQEELFK